MPFSNINMHERNARKIDILGYALIKGNNLCEYAETRNFRLRERNMQETCFA
jgi:hypothetical protein